MNRWSKRVLMVSVLVLPGLVQAGLEVTGTAAGGRGVSGPPQTQAGAARNRAKDYIEPPASTLPVPAGAPEGSYMAPARVYRNDADYVSDRAKQYSTGKSSRPTVNTLVLPDGTVVVDEDAMKRAQSNSRSSREKARAYIQGDSSSEPCGSRNETGVIGEVTRSKDISSSSRGSTAVTSSQNCR